MKPQNKPAEKTTLASSGLQWTILIAVILLILIFSLGAFRKPE